MEVSHTKDTKVKNAEIPPEALSGGGDRLTAKIIFYSKLAVLYATEVNQVKSLKCVVFRIIMKFSGTQGILCTKLANVFDNSWQSV